MPTVWPPPKQIVDKEPVKPDSPKSSNSSNSSDSSQKSVEKPPKPQPKEGVKQPNVKSEAELRAALNKKELNDKLNADNQNQKPNKEGDKVDKPKPEGAK